MSYCKRSSQGSTTTGHLAWAEQACTLHRPEQELAEAAETTAAYHDQGRVVARIDGAASSS